MTPLEIERDETDVERGRHGESGIARERARRRESTNERKSDRKEGAKEIKKEREREPLKRTPGPVDALPLTKIFLVRSTQYARTVQDRAGAENSSGRSDSQS